MTASISPSYHILRGFVILPVFLMGETWYLL